MRKLLSLILLLGACSEPTPPEFALDGEGVFPVASANPERPRLRYLDGQVSSNNTCAIRLPNKLNPDVPPMYLNGMPVGFC